MSSFAIYFIGIVIVIAGVLYICHLAHMPQSWTVGIAILLLGAGLIGAVNNTRQRDKN
jgi:tellurite resistance protein TehA-like permease